ncbi:orotate phosphoribosyltransferase [hydrocarbon metagenome]|uniref:orotate phosphoribosyltransferase n=1 Tax=hydrocarbon metagenome TaxID=938273 RepID=A0A0W8E5F9_9ZZZZ
MLSREEALKIFSDSGALMEGHFLLTSGRHSNQYMQCAQVLQYPAFTEQLARHIADKFEKDGIQLVVGPAMGGIIVSYEVARQLGVPGIFAERKDGQMEIRRGFTIKPGQKVLVVEDVVTTGGSVKEVIDAVIAAGGEVAGVAVLVDRSNGSVTFGVKQEAVLSMDIQSWEKTECPLCKEGQSDAYKPGSRT